MSGPQRCPYCNAMDLRWGEDPKNNSSGEFCELCGYTRDDKETVRDAIDRHSADRVAQARRMIAEAEEAQKRRPKSEREELTELITKAGIRSGVANEIAAMIIAEGWKKSA